MSKGSGGTRATNSRTAHSGGAKSNTEPVARPFDAYSYLNRSGIGFTWKNFNKEGNEYTTNFQGLSSIVERMEKVSKTFDIVDADRSNPFWPEYRKIHATTKDGHEYTVTVTQGSGKSNSRLLKFTKGHN